MGTNYPLLRKVRTLEVAETEDLAVSDDAEITDDLTVGDLIDAVRAAFSGNVNVGTLNSLAVSKTTATGAPNAPNPHHYIRVGDWYFGWGAGTPTNTAGIPVPAVFYDTANAKVYFKWGAGAGNWTQVVNLDQINPTFNGVTINQNFGLVLNGFIQGTIRALTYVSGGVTLIDANDGALFELTLAGATTELDNPTNMSAGMEWTVIVHQDATGGRALTFDTWYDFGAAGAPNLAALAANKTAMISCLAISETQILCVYSGNYA